MKLKNIKNYLVISSFIVAITARAQAHLRSSRPDGHAPISVMGDHTHRKGEWMVSYRYKSMHMEDNRTKNSRIADHDVLKSFMITPTKMTMSMLMVGVMAAPSNQLTLMAMFPYRQISMDHLNRMGRKFTTQSQGLGDIQVSGLYSIWGIEGHKVHLNLGVSFPSGSINRRDNTPLGSDQKLSYPMQLGSGTHDLLPGLTYVGQVENWSWGAQPQLTLRVGQNANGYKLGDKYQFGLWGARKLTSWLSSSVQMIGQAWRNIHGQDTDLNARMVPTADPVRRQGERIDTAFGLNFYVPPGHHPKGQRIAVEFGLPVYQSLEGPQLETDWVLSVGWQWAFGGGL